MNSPRCALGKNGRQAVQPDEPAWAEVGRLDPNGECKASCELIPGRAVRLSARIIRVTANNSGMMTGPGTNTYLIGGGTTNEWTVIDPGPLDAQHVEAILSAAPGPIRRIFVTHTHNDHSPATLSLKAKTGAMVYGQMAAFAHHQDASFVPDQVLRGTERIALPGNTTLRVIHTPGHASNHLCYLLEQEKTLFTGDHIMQGTTVIINPPDGNMAAYLASLRSLLHEDIEWLAPGHGFLMAQPQRAMHWIIEHRLQREAKIVAALRATGPVTASELLKQVYRDVSERLHGVAMRSLLAHLIKLQEDGLAVETSEQWSLRPSLTSSG